VSRDDRLSPATYTVGELRDLAEKVYLVFQGLPDGSSNTTLAECAIDAARTFAQVWAKEITLEVKP
jgi:hypothetical protein